jgi:hypothetical protein
VSIVASENGVFFTKGDARNTPHAETLMKVNTGGDLTVSGGIQFPDGTVQTTAAAPTWHQKLPAAERFKLVMDGEAVLDRETGLVWAKNAGIQVSEYKRWWHAIHYTPDLSISDRKGWRVPDVEELSSLLDMSVTGSPKLPAGHPFINVKSWYWSSNPDIYNPNSNAWGVNMSDGRVHLLAQGGDASVWPVRADN